MPDPRLVKCAQRLKFERERLGLSQEDFAAFGGVKRIAQYWYEKGARFPNMDYLLRVQDQGVRLDFVLNGTDEGSRPTRPGMSTQAVVNINQTVRKHRESAGRVLSAKEEEKLVRALCEVELGRTERVADGPADDMLPAT